MLYCTPRNQTLQQHMSSMAFRVVGKLWICIRHLLDMLALAAGTLQRSLQRMSTIHLRCMITLMITITPAHQAAINSHQRISTCMWIRHTCRHLRHHCSSAWCVACNGLVLLARDPCCTVLYQLHLGQGVASTDCWQALLNRQMILV
jgi:hypothetical protein